MATAPATIDWNTGTHATLVSIGTHRLFASISGPDRHDPNQPVVVIMHGVTSTMSEWPAARRELAAFARVLDYDRVGYGLSDEAPADDYSPTAVTIAHELNALLAATGIAPPYVTVGHSWGGVLTLEFLDSRPDVADVAGMVFVDAGVPHHFDVLPMVWREADMAAVAAGVDFAAVTGLKAHTALSDDEWAAFEAEEDPGNAKHVRQAERENAVFPDTYTALRRKGILERRPPVLGDCPVCVVRGNTELDYEKLLEAGVAQGNGTEEQRARLQRVVEGLQETDTGLQRQFLQLSSKGHFIQAPLTSGHNVQITDPQCIADGVRWVLDHLAGWNTRQMERREGGREGGNGAWPIQEGLEAMEA
jgi:pimeloyl-ACP methyl ester carboxylesterase